MNDTTTSRSLTINIKDCDWQLTLQPNDSPVWAQIIELLAGQENPVIDNFVLERASKKHHWITMVWGEALNELKQVFRFRQPMGFERAATTRDKVGDIVIHFRKHPTTHRWMVQAEEEVIYVEPTETRKIWSATRSSLDNVLQVIGKTRVRPTGQLYSNGRRQGGLPIKTHCVFLPWAPQLADKMMDVFDFVDSLDSMGLASFVKALKDMSSEPAEEIFSQMRNPYNNGELE